ncbi:MAG: hypothetical protein EOP52_11655 [Sphingobacteriales bacterium]|nr:MAG: hypothetical protein EOP52_11655 [Sphingobacteriales bacterium]
MNLNFFNRHSALFELRWIILLGAALLGYLTFIDLNHRTLFGDGDDREATVTGPHVQGFQHK